MRKALNWVVWSNSYRKLKEKLPSLKARKKVRKCLGISMLTEAPTLPPLKTAKLCVCFKCQHPNICSMGRKQEELGVHEQLHSMISLGCRGRLPWISKGARKTLILKDNILKAQERTVLLFSLCRCGKRPVWMNKELLTELKSKRNNTESRSRDGFPCNVWRWRHSTGLFLYFNKKGLTRNSIGK